MIALLASALVPVFSVQELKISQGPDVTTVDNGSVRLSVDRRSGRYGLSWGGSASVREASGEVRLRDGSLRKTTDAPLHQIETAPIRDALGRGTRVTVRHIANGAPELRQIFWLYAGRPEAIVRLDVVGVDGTNHIAPVVTEANTGIGGNLQALYVPYDNDAYERYNSQGWKETSHEVSALYDGTSRSGLVVGSIDHDTWKSGIQFGREGGLRAFAGITNSHTRDKEPHGTVPGPEVRSPRISLGYYKDWRDGMERYGDLNAKVQPALTWKGAIPFGWNSWGGHKEKLTKENARTATDFFRTEVPKFRNGGTAWMNLDSFWDNLKPEERVAFIDYAHAAKLKAGTYWTPFVWWGELERKVNDETGLTYRDLALKDANGQPLPKLDGGWPLDPSHPAVLRRIDRQMAEFVKQGYDYIKLDFMTHGALEAKHHDPKIATGTQAYRLGMQRVLDAVSPKKIGKPFFVSLSIAPLFPHGYGHSRRVSCDVFSNIGASEYLLNSSAYGWWTANRLYRFNDPDHTVIYQAKGEDSTSEAEARTRFLGSVISGGMLLDGDDLGNPAARERAKRLYSHEELLALARKAPAFRAVENTSGDKAEGAFVWTDRSGTYVAAFNFDKAATVSRRISLARLGLSGRWVAHDLWNGSRRAVQDELTFDLPPTDCAIVRLARTR